MQAFGNSAVNALFGNTGSNILDGGAGADAMTGGAGNDAYFVDNIGDQMIENPGEGNDTVFSTVDFRLSANVDNLILQGGADLQGLRQQRGERDLRQYRQQHPGRRRSAPTS